MEIEFTLNGARTRLTVEANDLLLDVLRDDLGLTGTKRSCDLQVCGTCTVLVDDDVVSSCCYFAFEVDGHELETIEGFVGATDFDAIARAFEKTASVACGFCTPGFVMTVKSLLSAGAIHDGEEARQALRGNLCRCTGYRSILEAVVELAALGTGDERG